MYVCMYVWTRARSLSDMLSESDYRQRHLPTFLQLYTYPGAVGHFQIWVTDFY